MRVTFNWGVQPGSNRRVRLSTQIGQAAGFVASLSLSSQIGQAAVSVASLSLQKINGDTGIEADTEAGDRIQQAGDRNRGRRARDHSATKYADQALHGGGDDQTGRCQRLCYISCLCALCHLEPVSVPIPPSHTNIRCSQKSWAKPLPLQGPVFAVPMLAAGRLQTGCLGGWLPSPMGGKRPPLGGE